MSGVSTRDDMLDAAKRIITDVGYTQMSHSDITAAVGMGRTTFYEHFASKEELLVELVTRDLPPLTADIVGSVDASLPPDERLGALAYLMVEFVGTDHIGLILHTEVPKLSPTAQRAISEAHRGITDEFAEIYALGVASGKFRDLPARFAGRMMQSIVMTGGRLVMDAGNPKDEVERIARQTADTLVSALRPLD
jgi:AcrR family transcriptional regulator